MRTQWPMKLATTLVIGVLMAACKATPANEQTEDRKARRASPDCVFFSTVHDWQPLDDTNLIVWAPGRNDMYHVRLTMPLVGLKFAHTIAFVDADRDRRLCTFGRDALVYREGSMSQRSTLFSMERLIPEDIARLEEKYKVKIARDSKRKERPKEPDRESAQ